MIRSMLVKNRSLRSRLSGILRDDLRERLQRRFRALQDFRQPVLHRRQRRRHRRHVRADRA